METIVGTMKSSWPLAGGTEARRKQIKKMADMPRMKDEDEEWNGPKAIDSIEWFASSADLCRVLDWLDKHGGPTAQAVMSINHGNLSQGKRFTYIGFKSGSETG